MAWWFSFTTSWRCIADIHNGRAPLFDLNGYMIGQPGYFDPRLKY
jgi:hypothetical protein